MKHLVATLLTVSCAADLFGQGAINFNNRVTPAATGVVAPVYGPEPGNPFLSIRGNATTNGGTRTYTGPLLLGTGFTAQLWAGPAGTAENDLTAVADPNGTVRFRTAATFAGFVQPPALSPVIAGVPGGSQATMQIRAWDNTAGGGNILTWAQVMADPSIPRGVSDLFTPPALVTPPGTPPNMIGLTSFNLFIVPEPSLIALGALGLGALLLRRFRKQS